MPSREPSFSPYPFERLRCVSQRDAAFESAIARFLDATPALAKLAKVAEGPVEVRIVGHASAIDPHASLAEVRVDGISIFVAASARSIRALAQRTLGGPVELDAPRALTAAEHGIWCLVVAAAIVDYGLAGAQVWPAFDKPLPAVASSTRAGHARARAGDALAPTIAAPASAADPRAIELDVTLGGIATTVVVFVPRAIELRAPRPSRVRDAWSFEVPLVLARAAISRGALAQLAVGDIITVERTPESLALDVGTGSVGLRVAPRAVEATVVTGYLPRDMAMPDDASLELTVQLGTTRLSLRALSELAVGQIISLDRPLAGPFEVRAGGRVVGQGELIDIDGELGVRIVSLAQE